jgi:hypothetical protein
MTTTASYAAVKAEERTMDPNTPLTTQQFVQARWALAIGLVVPWVTIIPIWVAIERARDRNASRGV